MSMEISEDKASAHAGPGHRLTMTIRIRRYLDISTGLRPLRILRNGGELLERKIY
jgi:hypothetical protein